MTGPRRAYAEPPDDGDAGCGDRNGEPSEDDLFGCAMIILTSVAILTLIAEAVVLSIFG